MFSVTLGLCTDVGIHSCGSAHIHALACTHYLQHIDGTAFIAAANLEFADKLWVLSHQQVHEVIDLKGQRREGCLLASERSLDASLKQLPERACCEP